jgi:branched-chain amino acid transport system ATP-binding protein
LKDERRADSDATPCPERCTIRFGGLTAVSELDLQIGGNELVGLIGPNGAGKTTVFNLITGVYAPTAGRILFDHQDIAGRAPHQVTEKGIARTFSEHPAVRLP